jgi:gliding-associated putative ABC transporter substrate-binding component GldG
MAKEIKTKSAAGIMILIIAGILIVINLISINFFSRIDLTENNIYSLSDVSKELMNDLNDRLNVKAYITEELPPPHNSDARYLKDLLDDYKAYSHGNLNYEFIDPVKDDKEQEAMGYRIPPLQFSVFRNDKSEFIKGYKGVVLTFGDKQEVIPFMENIGNLEYDLSSAIKKLSSNRIPSVALTTGHGEPNATKGFQWASQLLAKEYRMQTLDLKNIRTVPNDIDLLLIAAPREPFTEWEQYLIDQFLMRGGRALFLLDKLNVDVTQAKVDPIDIGLDSLLSFYGINLKNDLVIDAQCNLVPVTRMMGQYQMQSLIKYPFYLAISNFDEENPIVKGFKSLNMVFVNPLEISPTLPAGRIGTPLFTTSEHAGMIGAPYDVSPEKQFKETDFTMTKIPLAAVLSGNMESYFRYRAAPIYAGTDTSNSTAVPTKMETTNDARIIVVGNGNFITDDNRRNEAGFALLLNMVDWLSQDKGLIAIRSRQVGGGVLKETSDGTKKLVKYINMFAMPIIVIVFGVIRWQFKRSLRRREAL